MSSPATDSKATQHPDNSTSLLLKVIDLSHSGAGCGVACGRIALHVQQGNHKWCVESVVSISRRPRPSAFCLFCGLQNLPRTSLGGALCWFSFVSVVVFGHFFLNLVNLGMPMPTRPPGRPPGETERRALPRGSADPWGCTYHGAAAAVVRARAECGVLWSGWRNRRLGVANACVGLSRARSNWVGLSLIFIIYLLLLFDLSI